MACSERATGEVKGQKKLIYIVNTDNGYICLIAKEDAANGWEQGNLCDPR